MTRSARTPVRLCVAGCGYTSEVGAGGTAREPYADRVEAGEALVEQLAGYRGRGDVVVLGLPRGGVPVAAAVATALAAPMDVLVVRKLGLPGRPEFAMGAVAGVGDAVDLIRDERVVSERQVPQDAFDAVYRREMTELRRREASYRDGRGAVALRDRVVLVVDDGLATGSTMRAAVAAVHRQRPARLVAVVPVGARAACEALRSEVDELVCPWTPEPFFAVGQAYRDFFPTSDEEVRRLLTEPGAAPGGGGSVTAPAGP